eukprot:2821756-Pleurochrysis_carterae.AAC.2
MEATDARRTSTALGWFEDFVGDIRSGFRSWTHRSKRGVQYNVETLTMFAEYIRHGGSRQRGHGQALSYDRTLSERT